MQLIQGEDGGCLMCDFLAPLECVVKLRLAMKDMGVYGLVSSGKN